MWIAGGKAPGWVAELQLRRFLWQEFGIPFSDATPSDLNRLLQFHSGEIEREKRGY